MAPLIFTVYAPLLVISLNHFIPTFTVFHGNSCIFTLCSKHPCFFQVFKSQISHLLALSPREIQGVKSDGNGVILYQCILSYPNLYSIPSRFSLIYTLLVSSAIHWLGPRDPSIYNFFPSFIDPILPWFSYIVT